MIIETFIYSVTIFDNRNMYKVRFDCFESVWEHWQRMPCPKKSVIWCRGWPAGPSQKTTGSVSECRGGGDLWGIGLRVHVEICRWAGEFDAWLVTSGAVGGWEWYVARALWVLDVSESAKGLGGQSRQDPILEVQTGGDKGECLSYWMCEWRPESWDVSEVIEGGFGVALDVGP
jgi:hypothetical protein